MDFWQGKCVFITGASSGIGWALAEHLAGQGATLGLIARRKEKLEELANAIRASGGPVAYVPADVTDADQINRACRELEASLGPCDVLIANAGIRRDPHGEVFCTDDAKAVFTTNVLGVVNSVGAVLPGMVERRSGHLVAVASIAAMMGLPKVGAYSASKAAVVTLMEGLRVDLYPKNVKVTTICPGWIETPMIAGHPREALRFVLKPAEAARRIANAIQRGRLEYWFPWQTWLGARAARALPRSVLRGLLILISKRVYGDAGGS